MANLCSPSPSMSLAVFPVHVSGCLQGKFKAAEVWSPIVPCYVLHVAFTGHLSCWCQGPLQLQSVSEGMCGHVPSGALKCINRQVFKHGEAIKALGG